jgi:hypothetical protein
LNFEVMLENLGNCHNPYQVPNLRQTNLMNSGVFGTLPGWWLTFGLSIFLFWYLQYQFLQHALQTSNYEWKYHLHKNKLFECLLIPKW